ncbi:MAG: sarcosine oxidase subunit delta [Acidimicrobiales bacterium]
MMRIPCPFCGPRNSNEFAYKGESKRRPDPAVATPEDWRAYLYTPDNPEGWVREGWVHRAGCRRYLKVERHTLTNEIRSVEPAAGA